MARAHEPVRVAVLASGGGSNLQALIDHLNGGESDAARVALVVSDRADAGALERARRAGIEARVVAVTGREPADVAKETLALFDEHRIGLVVLAGYLKLVPVEVVQRYAERIVNVHPALLPAFGGPGMYGMRVHRAVLESGVYVSGPTVHMVDEAYDQGRILAQWPVPVLPGDTPESLAARVLEAEHVLLPVVVEELARGETFIHEQPSAIGVEPDDEIPKPTIDDVRRVLRVPHSR
jgi:formyltetrahydrofolate-dependent phosphoribosylglycinamide formyltransferase